MWKFSILSARHEKAGPVRLCIACYHLEDELSLPHAETIFLIASCFYKQL